MKLSRSPELVYPPLISVGPENEGPLMVGVPYPQLFWILEAEIELDKNTTRRRVQVRT